MGLGSRERRGRPRRASSRRFWPCAGCSSSSFAKTGGRLRKVRCQCARGATRPPAPAASRLELTLGRCVGRNHPAGRIPERDGATWVSPFLRPPARPLAHLAPCATPALTHACDTRGFLAVCLGLQVPRDRRRDPRLCALEVRRSRKLREPGDAGV